MTLNRAKGLLQCDIDDPGSVDIVILEEAEQLGIEALTRISDSRVAGWNPINRTLPSETAE